MNTNVDRLDDDPVRRATVALRTAIFAGDPVSITKNGMLLSSLVRREPIANTDRCPND